LAGDLVAAGTDAERESCLNGFPSLVTRELRVELIRESNGAITALDYDRVLKISVAAWAVAQRLGDSPGMAKALDNIGEFYYQQGDYASASAFYQKSLERFEAGRKSVASNLIANQLLKIAKTEYEQGNDSGAIDFYVRA